MLEKRNTLFLLSLWLLAFIMSSLSLSLLYILVCFPFLLKKVARVIFFFPFFLDHPTWKCFFFLSSLEQAPPSKQEDAPGFLTYKPRAPYLSLARPPPPILSKAPLAHGDAGAPISRGHRWKLVKKKKRLLDCWTVLGRTVVQLDS